MEYPIYQFCSKCSNEGSINDFQIIKQGNLQKTCLRHCKKRAFSGPVTGRWDEFIFEINEWSHPGQTKRLDLFYTFDMRQLPVSFDHVSEIDGNQIEDYGPSNEAIKQSTYLIRDAGSHRFRKRYATKKTTVVYYYRCSQEIDFKPKAKESIKRDRHQMKKFACGGNLKFSVNLLDRMLKVTLCHIFHEKYTEIQLSPALLTFISTRCFTKTPIEIYQELLSSGINDADKVAKHQISYQWHQTNISTWGRDADPFLSAKY